MNAAIIDLGTNTCNLLIAETTGSDYKILYQNKQLVKLGDSKIRTNEISREATNRVIASFQVHKKIIQKYNPGLIRIIATSAIRSAVNKEEFLKIIYDKTGVEVQVISGEREAELIFKGALLAVGSFEKPAVILDIGGGSNELILANKKKMLWKESRPSGMGRVINRFDISDPIRENEKIQIRSFFTEEHKSGFEKCKELNAEILIGCSGAFDTVADLIDKVDPGEKQRKIQEIGMEEFYRVYEKLLQSTHSQRLRMIGMDVVRVDLIVPAVILIEQLISVTGVGKIIQTDYALREGVLFEMINKS